MEMPGQLTPFEFVEVRFKNGRKDFYRNATKASLNPGDVVVVQGNPGVDVGIISASGELARLQMESKGAMKNTRDLRIVKRKATSEDLEKWREARSKEKDTMLSGRKLAREQGLEMKISDVEYQADNSKATFFYTADGRVDFRELIKNFARTFQVRIEMKQIGARQEAGRLGGIGSCGRELCCSTWLTDFRSVSTSAARYQQLALNTDKLAGQCGKLKCCLNYELDSYLDALKDFPKKTHKLKTKKGTASHLKTDIFKGIIWYVYDEQGNTNPIPLQKDRVKEIIAMNDNGKIPQDLNEFVEFEPVEEEAFGNVVGQDSLTRFDKKKKPQKKRGGKKGKGKHNEAKASSGKPKGGHNRGKNKKGKPPRGNKNTKRNN
jgi:cell fate regulator YaaT (PSP1 superfamily)